MAGVGPLKVLGTGALHPRQRPFFAVQEAEGDKAVHCIAPSCKAQGKFAAAAVGPAVELLGQRLVLLHVPVYGCQHQAGGGLMCPELLLPPQHAV